MRIAISGAGIAGTTLAYWLMRAGHEPILVDEAPALRTGGYVIDFWGLGYTLSEQMGLLSRVRGQGYTQRELRFVDGQSRTIGGFATEAMHDLTGGRFTTIRRGALVEMIYSALEGQVETIFGDGIVALDDRDDGVSVTLRSGAVRDFDLVIGADGLHSVVRTLRFGPGASTPETYLGYLVGAFEVQGYRPRDEGVYVVYPTPSHQLARFALREDRTLFLFVFRSDAGTVPSTQAGIRAVLRTEFGTVGWEAAAILDAMDSAEAIYFDRASQIRMPSWTRGRTALVGDAAAAVSLLAGEGTGLAMAGSYVLAGEISQASGDHRRAFAEYERRLRPFIADKQQAAARFASAFVPETELGIWARNQVTKLMHIPGVAGLLLGHQLRDEFDLPRYPGMSAPPAR
jgi:2-polyprenyl-6-methoxyphenol hydroxylase-like FAD-dependent oxidoreductase